MDYCSSCRRHLNGALVCPGCGAYAPDIDPSADDGRTGPAPATAPAAWEYPAATGTWHDGTVWDEPGTGTQGQDTGSSDGPGSPDTDTPEGYEARPQGRAARRRQMARWKKNQRRAVVATAVALVGGGLTVASMDGNASPGVRAATVPEDTTMGGAEGEAPAHTEPTSKQYDTPRSSPTTPPHAGRASRHQQPRAADPRTTPADTRTEAATTPRELPLTTPKRRTTAPSTVDTVTGNAGSSASKVTEPTTPPASETQSDAQQPESPTTPPPAPSTTPPAASPSDPQSKELCLLVICLG
ncbi:SCO2400 family protein [Streptomyces lomondensis]|uniref:Uncharacterized protein n=1 Tax=Streptomyces lomondensis TaxID=68229 RepID=A0ABQ2X3X0_9ACTN|nr:hypothetical protein [Streptomyces lomondensis]MCF0079840.1 hypothetical protein [Streptomyces lomondensis]GGW97942.1 hypothetical protein GCM10010383_30030 [Streptomyces lomondensis]